MIFWPHSLKHGSINYMIMDIKKKKKIKWTHNSLVFPPKKGKKKKKTHYSLKKKVFENFFFFFFFFNLKRAVFFFFFLHFFFLRGPTRLAIVWVINLRIHPILKPILLFVDFEWSTFFVYQFFKDTINKINKLQN